MNDAFLYLLILRPPGALDPEKLEKDQPEKGEQDQDGDNRKNSFHQANNEYKNTLVRLL